MYGGNLPFLGVILCFLNQHPASVAAQGIWVLEDAEMVPGLLLLSVLQALGRRQRRTSSPVGRLYKVQKMSYIICLPASGRRCRQGKVRGRRCMQRQGCECFLGRGSCSPKMYRASLCAWQEGEQSLLLLVARQSAYCSVGERKG